jgi:hypothetical protein
MRLLYRTVGNELYVAFICACEADCAPACSMFELADLMVTTGAPVFRWYLRTEVCAYTISSLRLRPGQATSARGVAKLLFSYGSVSSGSGHAQAQRNLVFTIRSLGSNTGTKSTTKG